MCDRLRGGAFIKFRNRKIDLINQVVYIQIQGRILDDIYAVNDPFC
jgi:hypothetical protein